jgi:regulator of RNase E activity RraA
VRETSGKRGDFTSDDFKVGDMIDAASPGDIIVIDNGRALRLDLGRLATLAAKLKGVGGLVADSGRARPLRRMLEHKLPRVRPPHDAAHGSYAPRDHRHQRAGGLRGGVLVRPGDLIVGDGSGVCCIPAEHAAKVAELAQAYNRDDERAAAELAKGLTFREAMAKFRRI